MLGEPVARLVRELDRDVAVGELGLELEHELVHDLLDHVLGQVAEGDRGVEAVAERRREEPVDRRHFVPLPLGAGEAEGFVEDVVAD